MPTRSSPWRLEVSTYGEFWELLLGFVVLLPPEGAPLGEKLTLGVGFGLGVVLPARSSEAIAHGKWQDQACVDSTAQIYVRSTTMREKPPQCTTGQTGGVVKRLYRGASEGDEGRALLRSCPMHHRHAATTDRGSARHATQVRTDFLQRKTVHAGADVKG